jgi:hypothetical protein
MSRQTFIFVSLVVEALSGYKNGKVRQRGTLKQIY